MRVSLFINVVKEQLLLLKEEWCGLVDKVRTFFMSPQNHFEIPDLSKIKTK